MTKTYSQNYESWLSQLYYYLITSVLVNDLYASGGLDKEYWKNYYDNGVSARDCAKTFAMLRAQ